MIKRFLNYRVIAVVIATFIFINSIAFTVGGIFLSSKGIYLIFTDGLYSEARPGKYILESVDVFLLALVFLIFAIGIIKLFVPDAHQFLVVTELKWLKIGNFSELKMLLWEAVMITLVIFFMTSFIEKEGHVDWMFLVLPISIILLAVSYFVMKRSESHHKKHKQQGSPEE